MQVPPRRSHGQNLDQTVEVPPSRRRNGIRGFGRAVSRILSAPLARRRESFVYAASTRDPSRLRETRSGPLRGPLFGLAPDGVFRAPPIARRAVVSYTTFSPLPTVAAVCDRRSLRRSQSAATISAVCFLWHCPSGRLTASPPVCISMNPPIHIGGYELRGIAPYGVRTFLLPRIASEEAILRPSKTRCNIQASAPVNKARSQARIRTWR